MSLFIDRALSQLRFNYRVLAQAQDPAVPLLERLRFLFICCSNLDEFFEIRVASLKEKMTMEALPHHPDSLGIGTLLQQISQEAHELSQQIYQEYNDVLLPALAQHGIAILDTPEWSPALRHWLENYFNQEVLPVLSPISLDRSHPLPRLVNKSLNFIVALTGKDAFGRDSGMAVVHVPRSLPRVIKIPHSHANQDDQFVLLTRLFSAFPEKLFPGMKITGCYQFRLTRNSDLTVTEGFDDLANALQKQLYSRHYGSVARLEVSADCPDEFCDFLLKKHGLTPLDLYYCPGPVNLHRYRSIIEQLDHPILRYPEFTPSIPPFLRGQQSIFKILQTRDILLNHPFQSFSVVVNFIREAATDPDVLAIKQTLYRTTSQSDMVQALIKAAQEGKEVTAVIELRARFDESSNLELANRLQEAGVLVIYGVIGIKIHAKMTLIVRRENQVLQRYVHLGTGNYHEHTARHYTDFGLLTYDKDITYDIQSLFQQLTGMGRASKLKKVLQSPFTLLDMLLTAINLEIKAASEGKTARIIFKANGLTEVNIINALYKASQAGVSIDLIIRTACCLRPGIKGISDNIRVRSIVGRFLEHSRIYYFYQGGLEKIYCSSADLMERNLHQRVEVCFPIEDPTLAKRVYDEGLALYLRDNTQSWALQTDGSYQRISEPRKPPFSAQTELLNRYNE